MIAVHLKAADFSESDVSSVVGVFARAFAAGTARNERIAKTLADVVISTDTGKYSTSDYNKASELIAAGYAAAEKNRAALSKYAPERRGLGSLHRGSARTGAPQGFSAADGQNRRRQCRR